MSNHVEERVVPVFLRSLASARPLSEKTVELKRKLRVLVAALEATTNLLRESNPTVTEDVQCVLCFEDINTSNEAHAQIPLCRHLFHVNCFDTCVKDRDRCPTCRGPVGVLLKPPIGTPALPQGSIGQAPPSPPPSPPSTPRGDFEASFLPFLNENMLQHVLIDSFFSH